MGWIKAHKWAVVISVVLFFVGAGIGASGGSSSSSAAGSTQTVTVSGSGQASVSTVTEPAQTVTVTAKAKAKPKPKPESAKTHKYSGNGGETLQIVVSKSGNLKWTNDGDIFQIFENNDAVAVNSQAHSGQTFVQAGHYTIQVNAIGNWTITTP